MHQVISMTTGMTLFGKPTSAAEVTAWIAVVVLLHAAYAREVLLQVRVQTRLYASLPARVRGAFPDHPVTPRTVVFGSLAFLRAFLRFIFTDAPEDSAEVAALKTELRASGRRERAFAALAMSALLAFALAFWRR
jgi:hypothetical protein